MRVSPGLNFSGRQDAALLAGKDAYTSNKANQMLHRTGEQFWQDESYDHVIEDDEETARLVSYVEDNPVKAGLCPRQEDWTWSSARDRWEEWNRNGSGGRHPACQ